MQEIKNNKEPIENTLEKSDRRNPYFERIADAVANQPYNSVASPPPIMSYLAASDLEAQPATAPPKKSSRKHWYSKIWNRKRKPSPALAFASNDTAQLESRMNSALEDFLLESQNYRTETESFSVLQNVVHAVVRDCLARELRAGRLIISDTLDKSQKS